MALNSPSYFLSFERKAL